MQAILSTDTTRFCLNKLSSGSLSKESLGQRQGRGYNIDNKKQLPNEKSYFNLLVARLCNG